MEARAPPFAMVSLSPSPRSSSPSRKRKRAPGSVCQRKKKIAKKEQMFKILLDYIHNQCYNNKARLCMQHTLTVETVLFALNKQLSVRDIQQKRRDFQMKVSSFFVYSKGKRIKQNKVFILYNSLHN